MHYHLEIIMPPTNDVPAAIKDIMEPFYEGDDENTNTFWDFWVIGGRYSGDKLIQSLDAQKLEGFYEWLTDEKITVSGLRFGKREIAPSTQISKVDAKWNELFPSPNGEFVPCPIFKHSGDRFEGDIWPLERCKNIKAASVIIATHIPNDPDWRADVLLHKEIWNGVSHQGTTWDGTIASALAIQEKHLEHCRDEYKEAATPKADWLVVTVDYHS